MVDPRQPREHGVGGLPEPLYNRNQWIATSDKRPIYPSEGWNLAENQLSLEKVRKFLKQHDGEPAYVLRAESPFVTIDLDDVVPEDSVEVSREAIEIVDRLNTYTEWSRSRKGLHLICEGTRLPDRKETGKLDDIGKIEVFDSDQYIILTGDRFDPERGSSCEHTVRTDIDGALSDLQRDYLPKQTDPVDCESLSKPFDLESVSNDSTNLRVDDIRNTLEEYSQDGSSRAKRALNRWDSTSGSNCGFPSGSEADLGFAADLAFWCQEDANLIDNCFRDSHRIRPKWDEIRYSDGRTYGEATIQTAIRSNYTTFSGHYVKKR